MPPTSLLDYGAAAGEKQSPFDMQGGQPAADNE
jgi:hypothetical protein